MTGPCSARLDPMLNPHVEFRFERSEMDRTAQGAMTPDRLGPFDPGNPQVLGRMIRCSSHHPPAGRRSIVVPLTSLHSSNSAHSSSSAHSSNSVHPNRTANPVITAQAADTPSERLADLVHHLCEVPMSEARRAIHHNALAHRSDDPLAVVAGALVQLRNERRSQAPARNHG